MSKAGIQSDKTWNKIRFYGPRERKKKSGIWLEDVGALCCDKTLMSVVKTAPGDGPSRPDEGSYASDHLKLGFVASIR